MGTPSQPDDREEIARVAHAIWESEGRPEGRDHEHWMRAKELIAQGRAETEYPREAGDAGEAPGAPREVQPGFTPARPGMVPHMKSDPAPELPNDPGGRFATQIAESPETEGTGLGGTPGPRNPAPIPPTGPEGHAAVPSVEDATPGAISNDPRLDRPAPKRPAPKRPRSRSK